MDYLSPQDKPHFLGFIFKRLEMVEVTYFIKKTSRKLNSLIFQKQNMVF
jgi:hypothetical protein